MVHWSKYLHHLTILICIILEYRCFFVSFTASISYKIFRPYFLHSFYSYSFIIFLCSPSLLSIYSLPFSFPLCRHSHSSFSFWSPHYRLPVPQPLDCYLIDSNNYILTTCKDLMTHNALRRHSHQMFYRFWEHV